jgi:HPt (histidine-containing phosphotransfer) domain-containing protein
MKKPPPYQTNAQINTQIDDVVAQLWKKNLPTIRERLDLLDKFGSAADSGTLDEATRNEALSIAHKLAGSLGMYGYQQGTEVASKMERILKSPTPETLATLRSLAVDLRKSLAAGL